MYGCMGIWLFTWFFYDAITPLMFIVACLLMCSGLSSVESVQQNLVCVHRLPRSFFLSFVSPWFIMVCAAVDIDATSFG